MQVYFCHSMLHLLHYFYVLFTNLEVNLKLQLLNRYSNFVITLIISLAANAAQAYVVIMCPAVRKLLFCNRSKV